MSSYIEIPVGVVKGSPSGQDEYIFLLGTRERCSRYRKIHIDRNTIINTDQHDSRFDAVFKFIEITDIPYHSKLTVLELIGGGSQSGNVTKHTTWMGQDVGLRYFVQKEDFTKLLPHFNDKLEISGEWELFGKGKKNFFLRLLQAN